MTIKELLDKPNRHANRPDQSEWGKKHSHLFVALDGMASRALLCFDDLRHGGIEMALVRYPDILEWPVVSEYATPAEVEELRSK